MSRKLSIQTCTTCGQVYESRRVVPMCEPCREKARTHTCMHCGKVFIRQGLTRIYKVCGIACQTEYFSGSRHHEWKGGRYLDRSSNKWVVRLGPKKYRHEHRVVVETFLGRPLLRDEVVLFIGATTDTRLSNLYIFSTNSEYKSLVQQGGWRPVHSNLDPFTYKQPNERGQTIAVQENFKPDALPTVPVGNWTRQRRVWIDNDTTLVKTIGSPHPDTLPQTRDK